MRRITRSFVGLKHGIRKAVLRCNAQIRVQISSGVVHVPILRSRRAGRSRIRFADISGVSIHQACPGLVHVAHFGERMMSVPQIVGIGQSDRCRLRDSARPFLIQPVAGLNVVLRSGRRGAARAARAIRRAAQSLKQIVRRAIFLHHDDDVAETRNLRSRDGARKQKRKYRENSQKTAQITSHLWFLFPQKPSPAKVWKTPWGSVCRKL